MSCFCPASISRRLRCWWSSFLSLLGIIEGEPVPPLLCEWAAGRLAHARDLCIAASDKDDGLPLVSALVLRELARQHPGLFPRESRSDAAADADLEAAVVLGGSTAETEVDAAHAIAARAVASGDVAIGAAGLWLVARMAELRLATLRSPMPTMDTASLYRLAADEGHAGALWVLATVYRGKDDKESTRLFAESAELGHAGGLLGYARALRDGTGTERDLKKAESKYGWAAKLGSPDARFELGQMVLERDPQKAAQLFEPAAMCGHAGAQLELARLLEEGEGVDRSLEEAAKFYGMASALGNVEATLRLAEMCNIVGAINEAVPLYQKAEQAGGTAILTAQLALADMVTSGKWQPKDPKTAERVLRAAAEQGNQAAAEALEALQSHKEARSGSEKVSLLSEYD